MEFSSDGIAENYVFFTEFKILRDMNTSNVVRGKFQSPLLEDTGMQQIIHAKALLEKVSVVHNCNAQCHFTDAEQSVVEERESIDRQKYLFEHDLSNKVYILNRFYLGESWK